jgi:hypothetical protein
MALAATSVGNYALFAGGTGTTIRNTVDIWNSATQTWLTPQSLSSARRNLTAATNGVYAYFAGGYTSGGASNVIDIWNSTTLSFAAINITLSVARGDIACASYGNYVVFYKGLTVLNSGTQNNDSNRIDILNVTNNQITTVNRGSNGYKAVALKLGKYMIFHGGSLNNAAGQGLSVDTVDVLDTDTMDWTIMEGNFPSLREHAGAVIGNHAYFGGGVDLDGNEINAVYNILLKDTTIMTNNLKFKHNILNRNTEVNIHSNLEGGLSITTQQPNNTFYSSVQKIIDINLGDIGTVHLQPLVDNLYDIGTTTLRYDDIYATNGVIQTSDSSLKIFSDLPYGIQEVEQIEPILFKWKTQEDLPLDDPKRNFQYYGFKAENLASLFPELVYDENPNAPIQMNYSEMIPICVNAIKQICENNRKLEEKLKWHSEGIDETVSGNAQSVYGDSLKLENDQLKLRLQELENQNQSIIVRLNNANI